MTQQPTLPRDARLISLLLASNPSIEDAEPAVLNQLLEFSHRYVTQVLSDALVYAEHAGRAGKIDMDDVTLAVQARVGWEFGGRIPKEHLLSMASRTNATPLPPLSESYGVRLPPQKYCLTGVDFDLVPNKPPQSEMDISMDGSKGAGDEDGDEDDEDEDEDGEEQGGEGEDSTMDLFGLDAAVRMDEEEAGGGGNEWNGSGEEENDDNEALFEDDAEDGDEEMPAAAATSETNGAQVGEKRKLNPEDEDYD